MMKTTRPGNFNWLDQLVVSYQWDQRSQKMYPIRFLSKIWINNTLHGIVLIWFILLVTVSYIIHEHDWVIFLKQLFITFAVDCWFVGGWLYHNQTPIWRPCWGRRRRWRRGHGGRRRRRWQVGVVVGGISQKSGRGSSIDIPPLIRVDNDGDNGID